MKRKQKTMLFLVLAILILAGAFLLSGCISPAEFTNDPTIQSESASAEAVRFPDYVYDQEKLWYSYGPHAAVREDGYYLVINSALHFYDIQTDTLFPLCTKASCVHRDETCDAFIFSRHWINNGKDTWINDVNGWAANAADYRLYNYHGHLYTIGVPIGDYMDRGQVLFQFSKDFTEQKEIAQLADYEPEPRVIFVGGTLLFHNDYAYYLTCLYDAQEAWGNMEYQTVYTVRRVKLEEKAEPEDLFSFEYRYTGGGLFKLVEVHDAIYCFLEYPISSGRVIKDEYGTEYATPEAVGSAGMMYRYDEKEGREELIWSYNGEQVAGLFGAEGSIPSNQIFSTGLITEEGDYVYLAGYPEHFLGNMLPTKIASVNMETKEARLLYESPFNSYGHIEQLRYDGTYYYFIEMDRGHAYLTAIDKEGNLMRRLELELEDAFIKKYEGHNTPREKMPIELLRLLAADGRYIVLGGYDENAYQHLSSKLDFNFAKADSVDNGIGVIVAEDFVSGKEVEIRQIYERTYN